MAGVSTEGRLLPGDWVPATHPDARSFLVSQYRVPDEDVDVLVGLHDIRYSPSERRVLYPYYHRGGRNLGRDEVRGVWSRALPPYFGRAGGERPRFTIRPQDFRELYEPRPPSEGWDWLLVTEGAIDAIKATHYIPSDVYAVATFGTYCSDACLWRLKELARTGCPIVVAYDRGAERLAARTARKLGDQARFVRLPFEDFGAATPDEIIEWYSTKF